VRAVPSVLGAAPLEGEQETDDCWDEDYRADDVELEDSFYDGLVLRVVITVDL
jgi:hypothetical protein